MLISMTGFGVGHYEDNSVVVDVELKSFNSRYFELNTRSTNETFGSGTEIKWFGKRSFVCVNHQALTRFNTAPLYGIAAKTLSKALCLSVETINTLLSRKYASRTLPTFLFGTLIVVS